MVRNVLQIVTQVLHPRSQSVQLSCHDKTKEPCTNQKLTIFNILHNHLDKKSYPIYILSEKERYDIEDD